MISVVVGNILKKNTKTRAWWCKLALCLVLSNVFFFMLFGGASTPVAIAKADPFVGLVDVQLTATLLTPFQEGKRVLLVHRGARSRIEAVLKSTSETGTIVAVSEKDALSLLAHENWEVLPYLKEFRFREVTRGESHEIRY